jgi:hypothetical protein
VEALMEWKVDRAKKSDLPEISIFFKRLFQGFRQYGQTNMFAWKIFENTHQEGFMNLIRDGNAIVSTTSVTPKILILNNQKITVAEIGDTYTEIDYQRKGMFNTLINTSRKNAQNAGIQFIYGTPNKQSLPGYLKHAGFVEIDDLNIYSLKFLFSAKSKFRRLVGQGLAKFFDSIYQIYAQKCISIKNSNIKNLNGYSIDQIKILPDDWDTFWIQAVKNYSFIIDRSSKSQNWRYVNNPEKYSFLTVRSQGKLIGYCIYINTPGDGEYDISIADYLFLNDHEVALGLCLTKIYETAFLNSVRSINVWCEITSPFYTIFRNYGLRETNKIPIIFFGSQINRVISKKNNNHFTMGDSDNV